MGQAKARGTFAERQALAVVERERQEALQAEQRWKQRPSGKSAKQLLLLASMMLATGGPHAK